MGKTSISWTATPLANGTILPGYTFNPWWGCTKFSPGCDNCYAEAFDRRTGGDHFGEGKPRRYFGEKHWAEPLKWNREAEKMGVRRQVFCGSMCDWLDIEADNTVRNELFTLMRRTQWLNWLLLTKRALSLYYLNKDFLRKYTNIWLGVTVENKDEKDRINVLRKIQSRVRFLSCEPLLGPLGALDLTGIDWVIVGGESGPKARPMDPAWAMDIRRQCKTQNVAFFFKQHGGKGPDKGGCLWDGEEIKEFPK